MFRKPKNRGQRQRVRHDSDEGVSLSPPPPTTDGDAKPLLSFCDDEGVDVTEFEVKKQDARKRREKLARKAQEKSEIQTQKTEFDNVRFTNSESLPVSKVPEKEIEEVEEEDEEMVIHEEEEFGQGVEIKGKLLNSYQDIPDAHAVYEARKKREQMRKGMIQNTENDDGFMLLSGQKELEEEREPESGSDEEDDDHGQFYSSKNEMLEEEKKRRELQFNFLATEQGDETESGSEEEEVLRWEREQISKGVRKHQIVEARQEWLATTGRNLAETDVVEVMGVDAIVRAPARIFEPAEFIPIPIEQVITEFRLKLNYEKELLAGTEEDYAKIKSNIEENLEIIAKLERIEQEE